MQLYAFENDKEMIFASQAKKQRDYCCLECGQTVRLRSGMHRQLHFYHLQPNHKCRLNGKSMQHLMLQRHIASILPIGQGRLECRFPNINRIADVAWIEKKLIFEIQCSPISAAEIKQRNADYASQGYSVIWILHQMRYNQRSVTAAEDVLKGCTHYFSDMDAEGRGVVYDQLSFASQGVRKQRLPKQIVDLSKPCQSLRDEEGLAGIPVMLQKRLNSAPVYFEGDYLHAFFHQANHANFKDLIELTLEAELQWLPKGKSGILDLSLGEFAKMLYQRFVVFPYRVLFHFILERTSR